ncbi:CdaR family transcriptional regulator [Sporomusa acidovorans]|uniref:Carbohydrate diacid regulator n=1 Tax=Sporomusa acidovorans (strain ATCC 49682 / DSM 3132 / Mol) TaxID=1123286 RepID=A0ABZ3IYA1_SPOA4|nr:sugar diacid recognition domain-containing protein [Sporomusa acidovorans]OZC22227.1 carbohydrate diacid regulator [Sporomusa acidovorans DSM 3132]SDE81223.1 transcriptional regulator, CdaR family [Sporomusa acidovorans]
MIISKEFAQKVVDHLMGIVQHNVNIMDCSGIIIASGQFDRINTFHQGGKLAVDEQDVVEIYTDDVHNFCGALPGVMWPINLKEKIVGVVGVTGEPPEVRNTAKLVKTVTELFLEREMFLADYRLENWMKEQLVHVLFANNADTATDLAAMADMVHYRLDLPRVVILFNLEPKINDFATNSLQNLVSDRMRESVLKLIQEADSFHINDFSLFYKKNLCILKSATDSGSAGKIKSFTTSTIKRLQLIHHELNVRVGIGSMTAKPTEISHSYHEALFALSYQSPNTIRSISEYNILANYLFEHSCLGYDCLALRELKSRFEAMGTKYDMQQTLQCLLDNNLNVSLTAGKLYIHRNTLKFRLDKLKEFVGLEPCHYFYHAILCKAILNMSKINSNLNI